MTRPFAPRFLTNVLLLLASSLLTLGLLEGAVRFFDVAPRPLEALPIKLYRLAEEPVLRYEYRPYPTIIRRIHAGSTNNSQGFRDYEYGVDKPANTRRLVVLGDSTTVGRSLENFADTYPKRLEMLLNGGRMAVDVESAAVGQEAQNRIEVLSLAVAGYQTLQEVETLRHKGLRYGPDMVILTFCVNDYDLSSDGDIYTKLWQQRYLSDGTVEEAPWWRRWLKTSRLAFVVGHRLRAPLSEQDQRYAERFLGERSTVRAGLESLSQLQQEHGFPVLVVLLPELRYPFAEYRSSEIHQRVLDDAAGLPGLQVVDLLPYFAASGYPAGDLARDGLHLNALGHRVLSGILSNMVVTSEQGDLNVVVQEPHQESFKAAGELSVGLPEPRRDALQ